MQAAIGLTLVPDEDLEALIRLAYHGQIPFPLERRRLMELGLSKAGCIDILDDLPPMLTTQDGEVSISADFESMADEKLADAQKMWDEDFERSMVCGMPALLRLLLVAHLSRRNPLHTL